MHFMGNLKIRTKLFFGFGLVIVLSIVLSTLGIYQARFIDNSYSYLLEYPAERRKLALNMEVQINEMRRAVTSFYAHMENMESLNTSKESAKRAYDNLLETIAEYIESMSSDPLSDKVSINENVLLAKSIGDYAENYRAEVFEKAYEAIFMNDKVSADRILDSSGAFVTPMFDNVNELLDRALDVVIARSESVTSSATRAIMWLVIISAIIVVFSILIAFLISRTVVTPVSKLVKVAKEVSKGNFNINIPRHGKDEVGILTDNFFIVIDVVKSLIDDINIMNHEQEELGNIDYKMDESKYTGSYREVVAKTNHMVFSHVDLIIKFFVKINALMDGDFNLYLEPLPGKKAMMNSSLDNCRDKLKAISNEINEMINNIHNGNIDKRIKTDAYKGDWINIMQGLNQVLENFAAPIREMTNVLQNIANGKFNQTMTSSYKGEFDVIKNSVNTMTSNVSGYISEISDVLNKIANNNFNLEISRKYVGEFTAIKDAINNIIGKFNNVIGEISSSTEQVAAGAKQISESSMNLAEGATRQAAAVEELTATVMSVNEKTKLNADNANKASRLSNDLMSHALEGNEQMKNMLKSMKSINEASNNISKIITIIKDIAFQTNLLALNASIEAAHAGEHGAGFSVVADEVRTLAVKSQQAANNTTELIETSITQVNKGTDIAVKTDESLGKIIGGVTEVSNIISYISDASNEQEIAISQINEGVSQIAQVVQTNSATSEESASAAQQLSSQSDLLKNMVQIFELK